MTTRLHIDIGDLPFGARLEHELAPRTCAAFLARLPFESRAVHVRWSGEGVWMPLGDLDIGVGAENVTAYPVPGEMLFYPSGISETEIILAYGAVHFASKAGTLAGNHFLTIVEGREQLREVGRRCLWEGAQPIRFTAAD